MENQISLLKKIFVAEGFSKELVCAVLGNIQIESNFKCVTENMNYSSIERLRIVFPSKFKKMADNKVFAYVNNGQALGDLVYASLGGYAYRGRGFIQITGKANYEKYGKGLGVVENPSLASTPEVAAKMTVRYIRTVAFPMYAGDLNTVKDAAKVADIVTKAIQGPGKNYTTGFLKEHLEKKRNAALAIYKNYEKY